MLKKIFGIFDKKEEPLSNHSFVRGRLIDAMTQKDPLYDDLLWTIDQGTMKTPDGNYQRVFFVKRGDSSFLYDEKTGEKILQTGPIMPDVFSDIGQLREAYKGTEEILSNVPPAFRISDRSGIRSMD